MEVTGKIIQKLELQKGVARSTGKEWQKQEYILEYSEQSSSFPRKMCFGFFGDRVNENNLEVGDTVKVSFDIESRDYNGRWYTDIRAWRAEKVDTGAAPAAAPAPAAPAAPAPAGPAPTPEAFGADAQDDLPF